MAPGSGGRTVGLRTSLEGLSLARASVVGASDGDGRRGGSALIPAPASPPLGPKNALPGTGDMSGLMINWRLTPEFAGRTKWFNASP